MGTIVFSLDTETIWGRINDPGCAQYIPLYQKTSDMLFRLINLFEKYQIPVTWAFVGLAISPDKMISEFINNGYKEVYGSYEQDWFLKNINSLGNEIKKYSLLPHLDIIGQSSLQHDIGSHTFSHLYMRWQNEKERPEKFRKDMELFKNLAINYRFDTTSFIYPRNYVLEQSTLKEFGYKIYREKDKDFSNKWLRQLNEIAPLKSFTVNSTIDESGLVILPGSMAYRVRSLGLRRFFPISWIYKKSIMGMNNAIENNEIFHIWFHPFNFAYRSEQHFFYFEKFLMKVDQYRQKGRVEIKTMRDIVN